MQSPALARIKLSSTFRAILFRSLAEGTVYRTSRITLAHSGVGELYPQRRRRLPLELTIQQTEFASMRAAALHHLDPFLLKAINVILEQYTLGISRL